MSGKCHCYSLIHDSIRFIHKGNAALIGFSIWDVVTELLVCHFTCLGPNKVRNTRGFAHFISKTSLIPVFILYRFILLGFVFLQYDSHIQVPSNLSKVPWPQMSLVNTRHIPFRFGTLHQQCIYSQFLFSPGSPNSGFMKYLSSTISLLMHKPGGSICTETTISKWDCISQPDSVKCW